MPYRDQKDIIEMQKSLEKVRANGNTNVILPGNFNSPNIVLDIIWDTAPVLRLDREIQQ